jgi:hypothetical protein
MFQVVYMKTQQFNRQLTNQHLPFKDEAQTALFKDPVRTTL